MSNKLTGQGLADFAVTKIGTPYVYGAKGQYGKFTEGQLNSLAKSYPNVFTASYIAKARLRLGKVCTDCSGLISWYTGKLLGSAQMYSTAKERIPFNKKDLSKVPIGSVLWRSGHVGVYIGKGELIEAKGIDYGTVKSKVANANFTHYLLFDYITYDTPKNGTGASTATKKAKNPYKEPTAVIQKGSKGDGVKWVQWELQEAGYKEVAIDGEAGPITDRCTRAFQQSCKIVVDGKVGPMTRAKFKAN